MTIAKLAIYLRITFIDRNDKFKKKGMPVRTPLFLTIQTISYELIITAATTRVRTDDGHGHQRHPHRS